MAACQNPRLNSVSTTGLILSLVVWAISEAHLFAQPTGQPTGDQLQTSRNSIEELPPFVRERLHLKTPSTDKLLYGLEQDFVELLKTAGAPRELLTAEELLSTTNDNSRWTNYSQATRILREKREKAAIPLLLRYIVLHAERSSAHVMIPEYAKTISVISGHRIESPYEAGPNLPARMRAEVGDLVSRWWSREKGDVETSADKLSPEQLQVIVEQILQETRRSSRFSGSGGATDTAYGAYHRVFYGVGGSSSHDRFKLRVVHPEMVTLVLKPSGYSAASESSDITTVRRIPYEAIPVLAALANNGHREKIDTIAGDAKQNSTVRLVCILGLFQAGGALRTDDLLKLLENETHLEHRLVLLCSLRFGGEKLVPVLLRHMDDPNIEIATAAACALRDAKPPEALPKLERLIRRGPSRHPILLLGTLAEYQNADCRKILAKLLEESLKGGPGAIDLSRLLSAFESASGQRWQRAGIQSEAERRQYAHRALTWYREHVTETELNLRVFTAQFESAKTQLEVALKIEALRREEYKRLLELQGDFIVTPEQSKLAHQRLVEVQAEVKSARDKAETALHSLESQ